MTTTSTEKLVAGALAAWTALFGSEINSLANTNSILSSVIIDNSVNLDLLFQIAFNLGSITSGSGAPFLGVALYELGVDTTGLADGSVYGDGRFASAAAAVPANMLAFCPVPPSRTAIVTWSTGLYRLPPVKVKAVLYNLSGSTLAGSANNISIRTFNRVITTP